MARRDSLIARSLEPLAGILWPVFVGWTGLVSIVWMSFLSEESISAAITNSGLCAAALAIFGSLDFVWLLLGAAVLYLALAARVGLATARLWAITIFAIASLIGLASVYTSWPLGAVLFTAHLGPKIGLLSLGWPLWWFVTVIGARALADRCLPRASHHQLAAATGVIVLISQLNLEPLASKLRLFWHWYERGTHLASTVPWTSYATWWLAATLLALFLRERRVAADPRRVDWRPVVVLPIFNAVFLVTHIATALRK